MNGDRWHDLRSSAGVVRRGAPGRAAENRGWAFEIVLSVCTFITHLAIERFIDSRERGFVASFPIVFPGAKERKGSRKIEGK